jgi:hypothetical protein
MRRLAVATVAVLTTTALAAGCSRKSSHDKAFPGQTDWHAPGGAPGGDPNALPPPPNVGPGALAGQGGAMGGGMGNSDMPQDDVHAGLGGGHPGGADVGQMGLPAPDPSRTIDPNKYLRGQIHPTAATKAKIPAGGVIFIAVKRADPKTGAPIDGPPMAVERLTATGWPLAFELTEAQAMIGGTGFAGDVVVTARYDQDGDALSKQPGDVAGQVKATIPADKLDLPLDSVLP